MAMPSRALRRLRATSARREPDRREPPALAGRDLRRVRAFARPVARADPEAPVPPPLPPARIVEVPGRGEMFVRFAEGPAGADAPPVLLLHGWTASADLNWFAAYADLAAVRPVLAVDHRGHGRGLRTEKAFSLEDCADDAAALLRTLGVATAVVAGYSMGGPIALLLAQRHPDLVAGLVLEATALEWRASLRERVVWRFLSVFEVVLRSGRNRGFLERFVRQAVEDDPGLEPYRAWFLGESRRGDPGDITAAGRALSLYDFRPHVGAIRVPAAVVVTTDDHLVRPRKQRQLASALSAQVFEIDGDHDVPFVRGEAFGRVTAAAVAAVSQRVEAAGA